MNDTPLTATVLREIERDFNERFLKMYMNGITYGEGMMSTTAPHRLRQIAAEIEQAESRAQASVERLIAGATSINVEHVVDAMMLGRSDYNPRGHLNAVAGHQIGDALAKKTDFLVDISRNPAPWDCPFQTRFRATIYAFTQAELRSLLQRAVAAGAGRL